MMDCAWNRGEDGANTKLTKVTNGTGSTAVPTQTYLPGHGVDRCEGEGLGKPSLIQGGDAKMDTHK
jgi:hypothetical protein